MDIFNNGRVNMVITRRVVRYSYQKSTDPNSMVVHGAYELPADTMDGGAVNDSKAFQTAIEQLVQKHHWKRKRVAFCLVDDTVVIRDLTVPAALSKDEAMGYIRTQIGHQFYLPFDNPSLAIDMLEDDGETTNVRLYAYPQEKITGIQQALASAGLRPVIADLTSLSVYRYYYDTTENASDHVLLLHWNRDALYLTAFQQHKAVFNRHLKMDAEGDLTRELADELISDSMTEIRRIIDFYQYSITRGEARIGQLVVSGDFPYLPEVKRQLTDSLALPIYEWPETELGPGYSDLLGLGLKNGG